MAIKLSWGASCCYFRVDVANIYFVWMDNGVLIWQSCSVSLFVYTIADGIIVGLGNKFPSSPNLIVSQ